MPFQSYPAAAIGGAMCLALIACTPAPNGALSSGENPVPDPEAKSLRLEKEPAAARGATARQEAMVYRSTTSLAADHSLPNPAPPVRTERENYAHFEDNPLRRAAEHPVSTFSVDVDTGAYANVRRWLNDGRLPPEDAVRVEEMINYFDYAYAPPGASERPFAVHTEIAPTPWNGKTHLLRLGLKGFEVSNDVRPPANLVFLVDVSGSMQSRDKLELLKSSLKLLTRRLEARDRIAIAVYAGASGTVLEPTSGKQRARIEAALDGLTAGGSTNGGAGIRLAYSLAKQSYIEGGINRVVLATDGDFNVGTVDFESLKDLVERKRDSGVALSTLGFGRGNYNDHLMEQLADAGNGNHAYIDNLNEARKVLVSQMSGTLQTIAKDVKIQIEFNPAVVAEYRLIGYQNRVLRREDFSNDRVDAGEIGAGHSVTALYEIALAGSGGERIEPLRHGKHSADRDTGRPELAFLRLRYKQPDGGASALMERALSRSDIVENLDETSDGYRFAAAVAAFGQLLRGGTYTGEFQYEDVARLPRASRGADPFGYRGEFLALVGLTQALATERVAAARN